MIYLASPYSDPDPAVQEMRFHQVCRVVAAYMQQQTLVYSPIAHSHPVAFYGLPRHQQFWKHHNEFMIAACDKFVVLQLRGHLTSKGVTAELKFAKSCDKSIGYETYGDWFPGVKA